MLRADGSRTSRSDDARLRKIVKDLGRFYGFRAVWVRDAVPAPAERREVHDDDGEP
jgi:hypothetical protein